jgi:hypothetical protein
MGPADRAAHLVIIPLNAHGPPNMQYRGTRHARHNAKWAELGRTGQWCYTPPTHAVAAMP